LHYLNAVPPHGLHFDTRRRAAGGGDRFRAPRTMSDDECSLCKVGAGWEENRRVFFVAHSFYYYDMILPLVECNRGLNSDSSPPPSSGGTYLVGVSRLKLGVRESHLWDVFDAGFMCTSQSQYSHVRGEPLGALQERKVTLSSSGRRRLTDSCVVTQACKRRRLLKFFNAGQACCAECLAVGALRLATLTPHWPPRQLSSPNRQTPPLVTP
jgi:hypothetical protein